MQVTTTIDDLEWSAIVAEDPLALPEHLPSWRDSALATGRFADASRLYRFGDGRRFVVPLLSGTSRHSRRAGYPTGWGIGGVVGADLDAKALSAIFADLASGSSLYTQLRPNPLQAQLYRGAAPRVARTIARRAHVVQLEGGVDEAWSRLRRSGRAGVKRARSAEVTVSLHLGGEQLDTYYQQLHLPAVSRWAERQREPLKLAQYRAERRDPLSKLQAIASCLGSRFRLYLAWQGDRPLAGNVVLWGPNNAHATRGAMDYEAASGTRAFYLLDWTAISDASEAGFGSYQMGETGQNRSLADYKERFGALRFDYSEYRFEKLPILAADTAVRTGAKRLIGFRDH